MKDIFVKKDWSEESILFYLHFKDGQAVRQVEVSKDGTKYLSIEKPIQGASMLYDQALADLHLENDDFITENEFEQAWLAKV